MRTYRILIVLIVATFAAKAQEMVEVRTGSFTMGNASYSRENPIRTVTIGRFYLSKYPVTNEQFAAFLNAYRSDTVKEGTYVGKPLFVEDSWGIVRDKEVWKAALGYETFPAVKVTWYGAETYCNVSGGRLPTEAEWEYAAKGGTSQQSYTYSGSNTASTVAWFYDNSNHLNHAVGQKSPNSLGLYDMSGNVYQWCADWFGRYGDFGVSGESNPKGPATGVSKVIRGGYRSQGSGDLHLTHRESLSPDECCNFIGFRLAMDNLPTSVSVSGADEPLVYPNPVRDFLHVNTQEAIGGLELLSLHGYVPCRILQEKNRIDVRTLPDGMYLLRVRTTSKTLVQKIQVKH